MEEERLWGENEHKKKTATKSHNIRDFERQSDRVEWREMTDHAAISFIL